MAYLVQLSSSFNCPVFRGLSVWTGLFLQNNAWLKSVLPKQLQQHLHLQMNNHLFHIVAEHHLNKKVDY
jgi:hypothetical protein